MRSPHSAVGLIVLCLAASATLHAQAPGLPLEVPKKADTRRQIDSLIKQSQAAKKKATLGLLCEAIDLSIAYGAPAWNTGNHDACANFYIDTAQSLAAAFPDPSTATPDAWAALVDLKAAVARTVNSSASDRNAWAMRFAFDKTELAADMQCTHAGGLLALGSQYLRRDNVREAQDAFEAGVVILNEMAGRSPDKLPIPCRLAPIALANALLTEKKYQEASDSILRGLTSFPEWAAVNENLRDIYGDPSLSDAVVDDLKQAATNAPNDPALQFLLGYEYFFTGQKSEAKAQFEKTLRIDPQHPGAKLFLNPPSLPAPRAAPSRPAPVDPFSQT